MSGRRERGTSARQLGTNPRARGASPRCMARHPRAWEAGGSPGKRWDAHGARVVVAKAAVVAEHRGDPAPPTSRAATMYLEANRIAGGPRPTVTAAGRERRSERRSPAGWTITARAALWAEAAAYGAGATSAVGPLYDPVTAEAMRVAAGELADAGEPP